MIHCVRTKRTPLLFLNSCYSCYRFTLVLKKKRKRVNSIQCAVTDNVVVVHKMEAAAKALVPR